MSEAQEKIPFESLSVQTLKGVGPSVADKLAKLGIATVQDILFHLPARYEDRTRITAIGSLRPGKQVVVEGSIEHSEVRFGGRRKGRNGRTLICYLSDGTGAVLLKFFHFNKSQQAALGSGARLRCFGEVRPGKNMLEMTHPEYRRLDSSGEGLLEETLTPVYPLSEGIHQTLLRKLATQVLAGFDKREITDWLPEALRQRYEFPTIADAIDTLHRPPPDIDHSLLESAQHPLQRRLIFEELLAYQLSMLEARENVQQEKAVAISISGHELDRFCSTLDFELTSAQQRVIDEILSDLTKPLPMMRLVQGDVGSGKTVVAAAAMLATVQHGFQVALMAPTEILVEQHFDSFSQWFEALGIRCTLLTSKHKGKARRVLLDQIRDGEISVVIGTHALFQDDVEFSKLALMVVDEQHRFGVHQRLRLRDKGSREDYAPHQLIMTATPIPRSLTMTVYADLDCSLIDELPEGRKPVTTVVVSDARRAEVITRISDACRKGEQAYWVCTLIDESEFLQCQAAEVAAQQLKEELDIAIGLVHGRMTQQEKEEVVTSFKAGDIQLLVATTVIEVGVDVPNASLMVIENPERLGLAQLHQLRGRVGRGDKQSACVLMYKGPLSTQAKQRLSILRESNSGFVIAQKDLQMRGPGEVLGTRQAGLMQMRIADIVRDEALLPNIKEAAEEILKKHRGCVRPIIERWLGDQEKFSAV